MRKKIIFLIFLALTLLWTGFIWSNSLDNSEISGGKSSAVVEIIETISEEMGLDVKPDEFVIRKTAHFGEFLILAVLLCCCLYIWLVHRKTNSKKRRAALLAYSLIFSLMVATVDEMIQILSPGRHASPIDVMIDFSGAFSGYMIFIFAMFFIEHFKNKKAMRTKTSNS